MNPYNADPATTTFTFFYQSAHNADRSGERLIDGAQSSTGPAAAPTFVMVAAVAANRTKRR